VIKEPLVSIIVPAYNHEKYIAQCLESILKQTYKNIELIIINDGSKDLTVEIIKRYEEECQKRLQRFIFIDKENEGISKTLNRGIQESQGEYICFLASDDMYLENKIEKQVDYMLQNPHVKVSCTNGYYFSDQQTKKKIIYKKTPKWVLKDEKKLFEHFLTQGTQIIAISCMYGKEIFQDVGLFDENLKFEDWDFHIRTAHNHNFGYLNMPLVNYRMHDTNISKNPYFMYQGELQIIEKALQQFKIKNKSLRRKAYANVYLHNAGNFAEQDFQLYKECINKAIKNTPFNWKIYKLLGKTLLKRMKNKKGGAK